MHTSSRLLGRALWMLIPVALLAATFPVRTADKRIVLIAGRPSHGPGFHEFRAGCLLLQKALASVPGITVQVYDMGWPAKEVDGKRVDESAALDGADAVLIFADGGKGHPAIQGDRVQVIDALAAKGAGLGFAHYGVEVPAGVPGESMQRWNGGFYETLYSVNPMWKPAFEKFPNHPITRGVKPFATHDEWYFSMRWTADPARKGKITPHPRVDAERRGPQGTVRQPPRSVRSHRRRQRAGRDDDVGLRAPGRRPQLRFHWRPHARQLGRRESAEDHAERPAVDRQGRRAQGAASRTRSPPRI